jgi:hypothetical protein
MARLIFQYPSDNLATPDITITVSTEDAAYPKSNLVNGNPANPFRFTATTGNIVFDFGNAVTIDIFALVMHNLSAGIDLRLQANATNAWSAPSLDQAITVGAKDKDGFPPNPWKDLTGIGSRTFRYWRLLVNSANSVNCAFGHVHFGGTKRSLVHNISWGLQEAIERTIIEHETDYYVSTVYDLGVKVKTLQGDVETSDAGLTAIRDWWDACRGRALPSLIVPDPAVDAAMLVRWADIRRTDTREFKNVNKLSLAWREVSRGLVL